MDVNNNIRSSQLFTVDPYAARALVDKSDGNPYDNAVEGGDTERES